MTSFYISFIKTDNKKVTKIQDAESIKKKFNLNCAHFKDVLIVIHEHLLFFLTGENTALNF